MQFRVDNARRQLQKLMPFCLSGRGNGLELESATKRCSAQVRPRPCCGARLRAICSRFACGWCSASRRVGYCRTGLRKPSHAVPRPRVQGPRQLVEPGPGYRKPSCTSDAFEPKTGARYGPCCKRPLHRETPTPSPRTALKRKSTSCGSRRRGLAHGFRAMQFNLVVATNETAVRLWQRLGFHVWNGRWRSSAPDHLLEPTKGLDGLLDCGQRQGRREKGGITKRHQLSTATAVICFVCVLRTDFMRIG
jgi:hypothetical protein